MQGVGHVVPAGQLHPKNSTLREHEAFGKLLAASTMGDCTCRSLESAKGTQLLSLESMGRKEEENYRKRGQNSQLLLDFSGPRMTNQRTLDLLHLHGTTGGGYPGRDTIRFTYLHSLPFSLSSLSLSTPTTTPSPPLPTQKVSHDGADC